MDLGFITCDYGTADPFRIQIYDLARAIPPGKTLTYGDIAVRLGNKRFAQAVGQAMGSNPSADHRAMPSRHGRQWPVDRVLGQRRRGDKAAYAGDRGGGHRHR